MNDADHPHIRITRGEGGEVEAEGAIDQFAAALLQRAGFISQPMLWGTWYRLPFDLGKQWENEHATYSAAMLRAARYHVGLDPDLRSDPPDTSAPPSTPRRTKAAMTTQPTLRGPRR
ncbi:hypothetical protein ACFS5L_02230 [Streptomyces phyllanthi]|uniref:Uncharacterized protein n=1 Tax=Streptomyces phyllanthi TaxID=1803180 RepID=A0A5N8WDL8_9ACTN|nr:hypothetical protein [Streptomyces phyllanthi]MPY44494.1 hypothetical protein [Streptomyces phyllanthi]